MPINCDRLRELLSRGEGTQLDYKRDDYDWTDKNKSRVELAKDLMALANTLGPESTAGYILIGVDENSTTKEGIPLGLVQHEDDANLHQRVGNILNRTPTFAYYPVELDGSLIGVYEIFTGGRPYYPLRDKGNVLLQFVPLKRDGTSTVRATPEDIQRWYRADNPVREQKRRIDEYDLARRILVLAFRARDAFDGVRSAFSFGVPNEPPEGTRVDPHLLEYLQRYNHHSDLWAELAAIAVDAEVLLGADAAEKIKEFLGSCRKYWATLNTCCMESQQSGGKITLFADDERSYTAKMKRFIVSWDSAEEDPFLQQFSPTLTALENAMRKHLAA